jgi:hypothetical protein
MTMPKPPPPPPTHLAGTNILLISKQAAAAAPAAAATETNHCCHEAKGKWKRKVFISQWHKYVDLFSKRFAASEKSYTESHLEQVELF